MPCGSRLRLGPGTIFCAATSEELVYAAKKEDGDEREGAPERRTDEEEDAWMSKTG
jgi:hypothetical protein